VTGDGVSVSYSTSRFGWGVHASIRLRDTANDHEAVYLKVEADVVDSFPLPNPVGIVWNRQGAGTETPVINIVLRAGVGSAIHGVRFTVCTNDGLLDDYADPADDCTATGWKALPAQRPHNAEHRATAQTWMTGSMARFQQQKAQASGPYDWDDDGCSVPYVPSAVANSPAIFASFRNACERHDFGYRNYGRYLNSENEPGLQLGPSDATKAWIDHIFLADMRAVCGIEATCLTLARLYYEAVRLKAGSAFYGR
jgi:hypothetical protein